MRTKNQHYVPRTYLRIFAQNSEYLWVYDKVEQKAFKSSIKNVASEKYFYDHEGLDQAWGEQWVEKQFARLESNYPVFFHRLSEASWIIDDSMKEYFSAFLTYQMFRTIEFRKRLKHIREQAKELLKNDPQSLERLGLNVESSAHNDQILLLFSEEISKQMVALKSWTWVVMDNQTSFKFISSDNPVVRLSLDESPEAVGIRIHLPLTPNKALLVMDREAVKSLKINFEPQIIRVPKDWVRTYNEMQIMHSHRQLYGVSDNFKLVEKVLLKWPGLKNVDDPKYLMQVVSSPAIDSST